MAQNAAVPAFLSLNKHGRGWRFGHLEHMRPNREVILGHYFRLGVIKVRAGSGVGHPTFSWKALFVGSVFYFHSCSNVGPVPPKDRSVAFHVRERVPGLRLARMLSGSI